MDQIWMVLLFAAVILVITLIAGYLPFLMNRNPEHMHFLVAFSAGVMLGVLFIMLPPEALERTLDAGHSLNTACYMILVGFVLLLFIDFMVKKYLHADEHADDEHSHNITSMSAFAGLSIHSFFDGLALAAAFIAGEDVGIMVLIALCLHKSVVVFSLSSTLLMSESKSSAWKYLVAFSVISPIATVISYLCLNTGNMGFAGPALCFSVGIFMFVTLCDMVPEAFHHRDKDPKQLAALIVGLIVVIVVSIISESMMGGLEL